MNQRQERNGIYLTSMLLGILLGMAAFLVFSLVNRVSLQQPRPGERAVVLDSQWNSWFNYPSNLQEERTYIDEALDSLQALGADTVIWSARTTEGSALFRDRSGGKLPLAQAVAANNKGFTRFDPLVYLIQAANRRGLSVSLLASDIDGMELGYEEIDRLSPSVAWAAKKYGLYLCAQAKAPEYGQYQQLQASISSYYYFPAPGSQLKDDLYWSLRCDSNPEILAAALTGNGMGSSIILGTCTSLTTYPEQLELFRAWTARVGDGVPDLISTAFRGKVQSQQLGLAYPNNPDSNGAFVVSDSTCFLMGTSVPGLPLTISGDGLEGEVEIARYGTKGTWGYLVNVSQGENHFTISQPDNQLTITLTRPAPSGGSGSPASDGSVAAQPGQRLEITDGLTSALSSPTNPDSISQTLYRGAIAEVVASRQITKGNKLTYAYQLSTGDWVLSSACKLLPMNRTERLLTNAEFQKALEDTRKRLAKETGKKEKDITEEELSEALGLFTVDTVSSVENALFTGITVSDDPETNCRVLSFEGRGTPAIYHIWNNNALQLTFLSAGIDEKNPAPDDFVTAYYLKNDPKNNSFSLTLTFSPEAPLWGWNVRYEDGTTKIYLKRTPTLSAAATGPLTGVRVLLDAGHGGTDNGAMGSAGMDAPVEKDVNLAETLAAKYRLEQLGATVLLTRSGDDTLTLADRVDLAETLRPDFFIALHHNSSVMSNDVNEHKGTEAYWFYTEGRDLGNQLVDNIVSLTGRNARGVFFDYYYVTRTNICPAVLLETGFMSNPGEYESVSDVTTLWAEGAAVAKSILQCVQAANN